MTHGEEEKLLKAIFTEPEDASTRKRKLEAQIGDIIPSLALKTDEELEIEIGRGLINGDFGDIGKEFLETYDENDTWANALGPIQDALKQLPKSSWSKSTLGMTLVDLVTDADRMHFKYPPFTSLEGEAFHIGRAYRTLVKVYDDKDNQREERMDAALHLAAVCLRAVSYAYRESDT